MAAFEWRSQTRLLDEVAEALRERIYAGVYAPGAILRQEHIAAEFGISRTPLREALRVLERDGLVIHLPGRGVRVASADLTRLIDAYAVREVLDGVAARFAAERATDEDIAKLRAHVAGQATVVDQWDPKAYTQTNVDFHMAVMDAAGNASLIAFVPLLRMTSQVFAPSFSLSVDRARDAIREHGAIVEAIASRDGEEAERLARSHIRVTTARLEAEMPLQENENEA
ncbi:GntR family transcriptional regulator [Brucella sp. NBRC 12950]|uniref:GntR family transcriptional regulator n=1 Tax=Brucella sp. NBRC 12950 TaxID=2994518 RepID=UPI0024A307E6|nr:GntR family transcriptional regulator [Brucella sp. NBRC 12950]GLU27061.1 GntR family transcriptional regulator [Brucella sp. NBRC 12950]